MLCDVTFRRRADWIGNIEFRLRWRLNCPCRTKPASQMYYCYNYFEKFRYYSGHGDVEYGTANAANNPVVCMRGARWAVDWITHTSNHCAVHRQSCFKQRHWWREIHVRGGGLWRPVWEQGAAPRQLERNPYLPLAAPEFLTVQKRHTSFLAMLLENELKSKTRLDLQEKKMRNVKSKRQSFGPEYSRKKSINSSPSTERLTRPLGCKVEIWQPGGLGKSKQTL